MTPPRVILITDPGWPLTRIAHVIATAASVLEPGELVVQLRDKAAPIASTERSARAIHRVTEEVGARLVLNAGSEEQLELAASLGLAGVHARCDAAVLGRARHRLGPDAWISTPAHTDDEVEVAVESGVDAVLVSPIFETPGKGPPRGMDAIRRALVRVGVRGRVRVFALGGVSEENAASCAGAGADGVAVIRALLDADDPALVASRLAAPFARRVDDPLPRR